MSLSKTLVLGLIAGTTILLGLPLGRVRRPAPAARTMLNAVAVGILLFLLWDVLSAAWAPVDTAVSDLHHSGYGPVAGYGLLFTGGLVSGLLGLVAYEGWMRRLAGQGRDLTADSPPRFGPGTMSTEQVRAGRIGLATWRPGRRLALLIAVGIGLHNLAEGLAIGQSAASGAIALATLLVIGFALHNATEGFGIVAPLAADARDGAPGPSWRFLLTLGAIGGGPTFVGTVVGYSYTSEPLSVAFLTLAAGSILYVVVQLIGFAARDRRGDLLAYGLLLGLLAGFATDAIVSAAGV